jgi:hypothetical protein
MLGFLLLPVSLQDGAAQSPARPALPDSTKVRTLAPITVVGRRDDLTGIASAASEGHVASVELRFRPLLREGELLETVPGMIATQHSGDGKANQYFLRGFNLDHGTDFRIQLEGMPVNMPSHAHGQGYADLNILIPELVAYLDYRLGVYHADLGDFASAGGAEIHLVRRLDRPLGAVEAGENGLARVLLGESARVGPGDLLVSGEAKHYDGPWNVSERLRKFSGLTRYSWQRGSSTISILGMAYQNQWDATDQIPRRAVTSGHITRFGVIDSTDGGHARRYSLSGSWRHVGAGSVQDLQLFGIYSDLNLFSNFTYFLDDPVHGDQFNQRESRVVLGGSATHSQPVEALGVSHGLNLGLQTRADFVSGLGLHRTQSRVRLGTVRQDDVGQWGAGVWIQAQSRWRPWFRSVLGVRGDLYTFRVAADRPENAGHRTAGIASPKASLVFAPSARTELYVSGGLGFHSNDARGTTITINPATGTPAQPVDPVVRSRGAEVGIRLSEVTTWRSTLALWALELDSELLFTGDAGTTEPSAASRRYGITWANFYRPIPQLSLDADGSFSHARFVGMPKGMDHIPGALETVLGAGATWAPKARGPFGSLRFRQVGSYPLSEDNRVRGRAATIINGEIGLLVAGIRVQASVLNALNTVANDIQYYYPSRLTGEPPGGVDDVHFHPVEPRQIRISLGWGL